MMSPPPNILVGGDASPPSPPVAEPMAITTIIDGTDCTYDTLFTFVDFNWKKIKSNAAMVFSPEQKVETALFWYKRKL